MKLFNWLKKASKTARALGVYMPLGLGAGLRNNYESFAREGYAQNSVVHACIREIAEASAGVPWSLYRALPGGERAEVLEHPLIDLLRKPNPLQGRFEFIESLVAYLYLSGNAYIESVFGNHSAQHAGVPRELFVLRPDRITVLPDPINLVGGYEYRAGGQSIKFSPDQILHQKLFNPLDDWYGLSPVQVAALAVDKMNTGDQWNTALLKNAAVPSGALVAKQHLADDQFKRLREEMQNHYQGALNAHKPLLLEGDLDWKEIGISPREMDWIEGVKQSGMQIAQIYNVPPELIGLQQATFQNRKEARKALYSEVVLPALKRLRDALNNWLTPRFGEDLALDLDVDGIEALSEDRESLWNRANRSAFLTLNEKRALVGYGPVPEGETLLIPNSQRPLAASKETADDD